MAGRDLSRYRIMASYVLTCFYVAFNILELGLFIFLGVTKLHVTFNFKKRICHCVQFEVQGPYQGVTVGLHESIMHTEHVL